MMRFSVCVYLLISALCCPVLQADVGQLLNGETPTEAAAPAAALSEKPIATALAETKQELDALNQWDEKARAGYSDEDIAIARATLENLQRAFEDQQANAQRLSDVQKRQAALAAEQAPRLSPEQGPPYAITLVDHLARQLQQAEASVSARELQLDFIKQQLNTQLDAIKNAQSVKRLKDEALELNKQPEQQNTLKKDAYLAALALREAQAQLGVVESTLRYNEAFLHWERDKQQVIFQQVQPLKQAIRFEKTDLDPLLEGFKKDQDAASKDAQFIAKYSKQVRRHLDALHTQITAEKAKPTPDNTPSATVLDLEKQMAEHTAELERAERLTEMVQHAVDVSGIKRSLWEARFKLFTQRNTEQLTQAQAAVNNTQRWLDSRSQVLINKMNHETLEYNNLNAAVKKHIDFNRVRERVLADYDWVQWLTKQLQREIDHNPAQGSVKLQLGAALDALSYYAKNLWNYELFTANDTLTIEGKSVTLNRSVTVAKLVRALIFIALGALGVILIARWVEQHAIKHWEWKPEAARIAHRWIRRLGVAGLIVSAMAWANIPLSIFAFMGGALAIGFGFGVQNLFKNLISGVMLLLERPLRIGDLVEVDGVRGSVVNIGIRSVTIRNGNGIETLVPNSVFIEQKLTNWTYTNPIVRFEFKVGVDYHAPVVQVREIIMAALEADPAILTQPKPDVSLDEFGTDSLIFGVYYWLDLSADGGSRNIASELRYTICKQFAAANINMAYTQREVTLRAASPLPVTVFNPQEDPSG